MPGKILSFNSEKEDVQAHLRLFVSKCHIVGNLMSQLIS